jgi:hypothetical protein
LLHATIFTPELVDVLSGLLATARILTFFHHQLPQRLDEGSGQPMLLQQLESQL